MTTRRPYVPLRPGRRAFLTAIAVGILAACGGIETIQQRDRSRRLTDQLRIYGKLVRWNEFETARGYIRLRAGTEVEAPNRPELLSAIKVTHYRLRDTVFNEDLTEGIATFELRYFHRDTRREVSSLDRQLWYWDGEASQWRLDGTLPDFSGAH